MSIPVPGAAFAYLHEEVLHDPSELRRTITAAYCRDEREAVQDLMQQEAHMTTGSEAVARLARTLVSAVRQQRIRVSGIDALMHEFSLSSKEGIALMCLAEAVLRIPDHQTVDRLIADKISRGDWRKHIGKSTSLFVNAATWSLLITDKIVTTNSEQGLHEALTQMLAKYGKPIIRKGVDLAMRLLGKHFVTGQTITEALANSKENEARGYRYSYDMLGEAALTEADALRYYTAYEQAIIAIGRTANGRGVIDGPGISVKLSALHPRYVRSQRARVMQELLPRLKALLLLAQHYDIGLNIDAEEADRLELSLDLIEALAFDPAFTNYTGLGIVIQAYQKRCPFVIDYLLDLARRSQRKFMIRLVKGAYWDSEIKRAQVAGLDAYPVYTRKLHTDMSYLVCAKKLLNATALVYPQFATHNAQTLATIDVWARQSNITAFEFQCLHGMGETLYDQVVGPMQLDRPCRIYAPVGSHQTLLAYLVRRLLENGANSSFVNQIVDESVSIENLIASPFSAAKIFAGAPHDALVLPADLFGAHRKNSAGIDFSNEAALRELDRSLSIFDQKQWQAMPLIDGVSSVKQRTPIFNPACHTDIVGFIVEADADDVAIALAVAEKGSADWYAITPSKRAAMLIKAADLLETHRGELMALAVREAGKSLPHALAEVREATDFLRYYAGQVSDMSNALALGPVACISPWNFPLAIFIGGLSAALAAGNVVLAKPAEQTPLIAYRAVQLLHEAGIPRHALQYLPGNGSLIGAMLTADTRIRGVIFTGSTDVAHRIDQTLAQRAMTGSGDVAFIAETGGQNAMIADSSALPEQVVIDVIESAFGSAGQRCSALRVLCLQEEIADKILFMLCGAMQELNIGNPASLACDVGPVIDAKAKTRLLAHIEHLRPIARQIFQLPLGSESLAGTFVAPTLIEIHSLDVLQQEVFGPVLHVLRYQRNDLPQLLDALNATGYGLTLGIHTRIDETVDFIRMRACVGNIYVNRNIVGAMVGSQPFGGEGLSGTGPKSGGPLFLKRLQTHPDNFFAGQTLITMPQYGLHFQCLLAFIAWARLHDHTEIARLGEHYLNESLLPLSLSLPGPTGETNTLTFAARGFALCVAFDIQTFLHQLAAVFATGNKVIVLAHESIVLPKDFPEEVDAAITFIDFVTLKTVKIDLALLATPALATVRSVLAQRSGAVIPIIETTADAVIPLWRLVSERTICINTTATGGNASLLAMQT
jgi:RHH-type proline utilization regulon transcriptional repressor/proline dehydrogenase/delta 1-pyrroline-5-carboxylate dehydrogenase